MGDLSRRKFLLGAAAGTAVLGVGMLGCTPQGGDSSSSSSSTATAAAGIPDTWDEESDVVILGAGGTGMSAGITAAMAGASVTIYDMAAQVGGNTSLSGGLVQAAGTKWQKEMTSYQDDTPEKHAECYYEQSDGLAEKELLDTICGRAPELVDWMNTIGVEWVSMDGNRRVPYVDPDLVADRIHGNSAGSGVGITDPEYAEAQNQGVAFSFNSKAVALYRDPDKGVVGAQIEKNGNTINVKANKGLILALGGIDHNEEMSRNLNPQQYWALTTQACVCTPNNNGDGIRMGMAIGAAPATHGGTIDIDLNAMLGLSNNAPTIPYIAVNAAGARFVCEDATYAYILRAAWQQEMQFHAPNWLIMDQNMVEQGVAPWAADPDAAVKDGEFYKADTIEELASMAGLPSANLQATITTWNDTIVPQGTDPYFQRDTAMVALNKPPYYASRIRSSNLGSLGGLKINTKTQVLDEEGNVIPRLYAGGMNSGGWYGNYYPGSGTALMGCAVTGRIAGEEASAADAWS